MPSESRAYRTIKSLVFDHVHQNSGKVDYEILTQRVREHFPDSKWKKTHWAWYRHEITRGRFRDLFTEEERANLMPSRRAEEPTVIKPVAPTVTREMPPMARGPKPKDPEVKRLGDPILNHARFVISLASKEDDALRFKLNRWVFSRLLQDEIRVKRPIKQKLWGSGIRRCQACGQEFSSLRGVEIHRKNMAHGHSLENCELLCRECPQDLG